MSTKAAAGNNSSSEVLAITSNENITLSEPMELLPLRSCIYDGEPLEIEGISMIEQTSVIQCNIQCLSSQMLCHCLMLADGFEVKPSM